MSNQILAHEGMIVWDCFVGTGSLLVAAAAHGAVCVGSDIDMRVLKGLKKGKQVGSIQQNFVQYNLRQPDLLRMDLSMLPLRPRPMLPCAVFVSVDSTPFFATLPTVYVLALEKRKRSGL